MSLKRILALASGGAGDPSALAFAAWLAGQHDAVVDIVPVYPDSAVDMVTLGLALGATLPRDAVEELAEAERAMQARVETAAQGAAKAADLVFGAGQGAPRMSVLSRGLRPALALSRQSALADLVVIAQAGLQDALIEDLLNQSLLADRAPVLIARGDPEGLARAGRDRLGREPPGRSRGSRRPAPARNGQRHPCSSVRHRGRVP